MLLFLYKPKYILCIPMNENYFGGVEIEIAILAKKLQLDIFPQNL